MLAIINFKKDLTKGFLNKVKKFFTPTVLKRFEYFENHNLELIIYDVIMQISNAKGIERSLIKLEKEMLKDETFEFISEKGEWSEYLLKRGFYRTNIREYLIRQSSNALQILIKNSGLTPNEITISVYEKEIDKKTPVILEKIAKYSKNITLISNYFEAYAEQIQSINEDIGSAIIATDSFEATKRSHIIVAMNHTKDLIANSKISYHTVLLSFDIDYMPNAFLPFELINSYGFKLPKDLEELCPNGIRQWEFAAALYLNGYMNKNSEKISEFYSFGRLISIKDLSERMKRLDNN